MTGHYLSAMGIEALRRSSELNQPPRNSLSLSVPLSLKCWLLQNETAKQTPKPQRHIPVADDFWRITTPHVRPLDLSSDPDITYAIIGLAHQLCDHYLYVMCRSIDIPQYTRIRAIDPIWGLRDNVTDNFWRYILNNFCWCVFFRYFKMVSLLYVRRSYLKIIFRDYLYHFLYSYYKVPKNEQLITHGSLAFILLRKYS